MHTGITLKCAQCGRAIAGNVSSVWGTGGEVYHAECTRPPVVDPIQVPAPIIYAHGCVCPAGAEATCQGPSCPRRPIRVSN